MQLIQKAHTYTCTHMSLSFHWRKSRLLRSSELIQLPFKTLISTQLLIGTSTLHEIYKFDKCFQY